MELPMWHQGVKAIYGHKRETKTTAVKPFSKNPHCSPDLETVALRTSKARARGVLWLRNLLSDWV